MATRAPLISIGLISFTLFYLAEILLQAATR